MTDAEAVAAVEKQVSKKRKVGVIAVAYAASLILQNALFSIGAPDYSDPLGKVLIYHAENQGVLAVTSGLEAINMVLLLFFVTALHGLVLRRGGAGADWSRFAIAAGAVQSALFSLMMATHIAVIVTASRLIEPTPTFGMMWQLHSAVFTIALPALGATFIGAAFATHASGLARPWQRVLGVVGAGLTILAGLGNLAIASGSPLLLVGVMGLAMWIVWLIAMGIRLICG